MKHRIGYNRLGRRAAQRRALERGLVTSLLFHERIKTTKAKAKEVRRAAEKIITKAKIDSVHNRRLVSRFLLDEGVVAKVFTEIAPRYVARPGGYTRILKLGRRQGDAAEVVFLELVEGPAGKPLRRKRTEEAKEAGREADVVVAGEPATEADDTTEDEQADEGSSESKEEPGQDS